MVKSYIATLNNIDLPSNVSISLEGNDIFASFDVRDVFSDGELVSIQWHNPDHEIFDDNCICAIHTKDDPMFSGSNFVYIVKGTYVDNTLHTKMSSAKRLDPDRIGIVENSITKIRKATPAEKQYFNDVMMVNMIKYDESSCKVTPYVTKPILHAKYYVVNFNYSSASNHKFLKGIYQPYEFIWEDKYVEDYKDDIIFPSREACQNACNQLNEALMEIDSKYKDVKVYDEREE